MESALTIPSAFFCVTGLVVALLFVIDILGTSQSQRDSAGVTIARAGSLILATVALVLLCANVISGGDGYITFSNGVIAVMFLVFALSFNRMLKELD